MTHQLLLLELQVRERLVLKSMVSRLAGIVGRGLRHLRPQPATAKLFLKNAVFGEQVLDYVLLAAMDPAGYHQDAEAKDDGVHASAEPTRLPMCSNAPIGRQKSRRYRRGQVGTIEAGHE